MATSVQDEAPRRSLEKVHSNAVKIQEYPIAENATAPVCFRTSFDYFSTLSLFRYLKGNPLFLSYSVTKVIEKVLFLALLLFWVK